MFLSNRLSIEYHFLKFSPPKFAQISQILILDNNSTWHQRLVEPKMKKHVGLCSSGLVSCCFFQ